MQDDDEEEEDEDNEEGGGLSKSGKELKKLLGRAGGLSESEDDDDDDDDDVWVLFLLFLFTSPFPFTNFRFTTIFIVLCSTYKMKDKHSSVQITLPLWCATDSFTFSVTSLLRKWLISSNFTAIFKSLPMAWTRFQHISLISGSILFV